MQEKYVLVLENNINLKLSRMVVQVLVKLPDLFVHVLCLWGNRNHFSDAYFPDLLVPHFGLAEW